MQKNEINSQLLVSEEKDLNKVLLFCMEQNIDWDKLFDLKPEQYRVSQIIVAQLVNQNLIQVIKNEDNSTSYNLCLPLYGSNESVDIDINKYYDLFSNKNLNQSLGRKKNRNLVIEYMTKFLTEHKEFSFDQIVEQTNLWIQEKINKSEVQYVPEPANFIYKKDIQGNVVGSPLYDLLMDPITVKKNELL